jgi:hypothetical protein
MAATNYFDGKLSQHIFQNTAISGLGDTNGVLASAAAGCVYIAIGTAMSDAKVPSWTEANYAGYARVGVCRSAAWTVATTASKGVASNTADVVFGQNTSGTNCACYFAVYDCITAGNMLANGTITTPLNVTVGVVPTFAAGTLCISID